LPSNKSRSSLSSSYSFVKSTKTLLSLFGSISLGLDSFVLCPGNIGSKKSGGNNFRFVL
jgi:hypothetical protein